MQLRSVRHQPGMLPHQLRAAVVSGWRLAAGGSLPVQLVSLAVQAGAAGSHSWRAVDRGMYGGRAGYGRAWQAPYVYVGVLSQRRERANVQRERTGILHACRTHVGWIAVTSCRAGMGALSKGRRAKKAWITCMAAPLVRAAGAASELSNSVWLVGLLIDCWF